MPSKTNCDLTENQWSILLTEWLQRVSECRTDVEKRQLKRKQFVEDWCIAHGIPEDRTPSAVSVTRKLQHFLAIKKAEPLRRLMYFPACGCVVDCQLVDEVEAKYGHTFKFKGYDDQLCINCNTKRFLQKRDYAADVFINNHMMAKKGPVIDWPDAVHVPTTAFPSGRVTSEILACPSFSQFMNHKVLVRRLVIDNNAPTDMFISRIAGGKHPHDFRYHYSQVAENPSDGSIGLLLFGKGDFAMVDTSGISNEAIYQLSAQETKSVMEMETGSRQGCAGGRFHFSDNVDHDVASLSAATKHSRVFIVNEKSASTKLECVYINYGKGGEAVRYPSVYNDVLMKRLKAKEKKEVAMNCKYHREKYLSEMKSRLRCFLVMDYFGLENVNCDHWTSFLEAASKTSKLQEWQMNDPTLSLFDCALLEWCCSTGEMRNHQALSVHTDGNKSHSVETMQAFGRLDPSCAHMGKSRQVSFFRDAILCALWEMVAMRIRCGRDIWHLSLAHTYHLPDRSRDKYNTTWVHGP
jgi:hypothetical protein